MIRITTQSEESYTAVTIDGQMTESDLGEIRRVRKSVPGKVVLRLSGLNACADAGIRLLQDWLDAGARLETANPFIRMILEERKSA